MMSWIKQNPLDAIKAFIGIVVVVFTAGVAWASLDNRISHLEEEAAPLKDDVRETRDMVRVLCTLTPGCTLP